MNCWLIFLIERPSSATGALSCPPSANIPKAQRQPKYSACKITCVFLPFCFGRVSARTTQNEKNSRRVFIRSAGCMRALALPQPKNYSELFRFCGRPDCVERGNKMARPDGDAVLHGLRLCVHRFHSVRSTV